MALFFSLVGTAAVGYWCWRQYGVPRATEDWFLLYTMATVCGGLPGFLIGWALSFAWSIAS